MMGNNKTVLMYYIMDFDDNILHMDTKIIMEKFVNNQWVETHVSTTDFALFRKDTNYRTPLNEDGTPNYEKAYSNFRDSHNENIFLNDVIDALKNKRYAPSYNAFKKCLIEGKLLTIITARGHEPKTIRDAIEYIINNELSKTEKNIMKKNLLLYHDIFDESANKKTLVDKYLSLCEFIGVSSNYFRDLVINENICDANDFNPNNTEISKKIAVSYIVDKLKKYKISENFEIKIGFSDDDMHNIKSIEDLFKNYLKHKNMDIMFYVFDTSKNNDGSKNYKKIKI